METIPEPSAPKPTRKLRFSTAVLLALLLLALSTTAVVVVTAVLNPPLSPASPADATEPLIYLSGGKAYMACGSRTVRLDNASLPSGNLNGELCADQSWLFYIANHDKKTGEGDLMRVVTDAQHKPQRVAQGVYDAVFSDDGSRVLYSSQSGDLYALCVDQGQPQLLSGSVIDFAISGNGGRALYICGTQETGDLYSWAFSGDPEHIAGSVCVKYHQFSPNAENICYVVQTPKADAPSYSLYIKLGSGSPEKLAENASRADAFYGTCLKPPLTDSGQMVYYGGSSFADQPMYLYSPGEKTQRFASGHIWAVFNDGSFVFTSEGGLYYKAPGQQVELLSDNPHGFFFASYRNRTLYNLDTEKRLLLFENAPGTTAEVPEYVTVYEQELGSERTALCVADKENHPVTFNDDLTRLAFLRDGVLYVMQKENGGWSEPVTVCDEGCIKLEISQNSFDSEGKYLYYVKRSDADPRISTLYRYSLAQGENTLLMDNVGIFELIGDVPYVLTPDGALFLADTGKRIMRDYTRITEAQGGIHILTESDLLYYGKGALFTVKLGTDAKLLNLSDITPLPPLTDEIATKLETLCTGALDCIDTLEGGGTCSSAAEYIELANELRYERSDVSPELHGILWTFSYGFTIAETMETIWLGSATLDEDWREQAVRLLKTAVQACREYMEQSGKG